MHAHQKHCHSDSNVSLGGISCAPATKALSSAFVILSLRRICQRSADGSFALLRMTTRVAPVRFLREARIGMTNTFVLFVLFTFTFHLSTFNSFAQATKPLETKPPKTTRILFIFDASGSMVEPWYDNKESMNRGPSRLEIAKATMIDIVDTLKRKQNLEMALRVYGAMSPLSKNDCKDSKLMVPFGANNAQFIKDYVRNINPNGVTPIAYSLEQTVNDFPYDTTARNVIILVTDGEESCGGDPCAVAAALQKHNVVLKPFVIGMNIDDKLDAKFSCIGTYVNPQQPEEFRKDFATIIQTILSPATIQVRLLDAQNKPTETDAPMTFSDDQTGFVKYNYVHTLNYRNQPDTINIDPVNSYDITVHTTPSVTKKHVDVQKDANTVVDIPTPQGFLEVNLKGTTVNNNINNKLKALVTQHESFQTLAVQTINSKQKYLTGVYDVEVLTLPRTKVPNVRIDQSKTTTVEVDVPGILTLYKSQVAYGGVFMFDKTNGWVKIYEFEPTVGNEAIALQGHRAIRQPNPLDILVRNLQRADAASPFDAGLT